MRSWVSLASVRSGVHLVQLTSPREPCGASSLRTEPPLPSLQLKPESSISMALRSWLTGWLPLQDMLADCLVFKVLRNPKKKLSNTTAIRMSGR